MHDRPSCPDHPVPLSDLNRRQFVQHAGLAAAGLVGASAVGEGAPVVGVETSESLVKQLYESLTETQRARICFAWDFVDEQGGRGLLRSHVSNNWSITDRRELNVGGAFFTADQQEMIEAIFFGLYNPEWHDRIRKQLRDDAGGYGKAQTIAIFGQPGEERFEFVMTGRHLTIRCDGNTTEHVAFGGPIFYGHAAQGFDEKPDHPGNVFWPQAVKANSLYDMLDGRQRKQALVTEAPYESEVSFRGRGGRFDGIPIRELSADQKVVAQDVLKTLVEPYRTSDQDEVMQCLAAQGGLNECSLAFYRSDDLGNDQVWDLWRLEGPSFVWHFRGAPHVHVWVNVANSSQVPLNAG